MILLLKFFILGMLMVAMICPLQMSLILAANIIER